MEKHKVKQQCVQLLDQNRSIEGIAKDLKLAKTEVKNYLGEDVLVRKAMDMHFKDMEVLDISNYLSTKEKIIEKWLTAEIEFSFIEIETQKKLIKKLKTGKRLITVARNNKLKQTVVEEFLTKHVVLDYLRLNSLTFLESEYHKKKTSLKNFLLNKHVKYLNRGKMSKLVKHFCDGTWQFWRPLDNLTNELLIGTILGDGYLSLNKKTDDYIGKNVLDEYEEAKKFFEWIEENIISLKTNDINLSVIIEQFNKYSEILVKIPTATFRLHKSIVEKNQVADIGRRLEELGYRINLIERLKKDTESNCFRWYICLDSQASIQMYDFYRKFYNSGGKFIPDSLELTENSLLAHFIDDGSYSGHKIELATNNFCKNDVKSFKRLIHETTGVNFALYPKKDEKNPNKIYWILQITSSEKIVEFLNYLESADQNYLKLVKSELPWKFNGNLTKKDALLMKKDQDHVQKYFTPIPIES